MFLSPAPTEFHEHARAIARYTERQRRFHHQWRALKRYANDNGVGLIGDLPLFVALDSADVWAPDATPLADFAWGPPLAQRRRRGGHRDVRLARQMEVLTIFLR